MNQFIAQKSRWIHTGTQIVHSVVSKSDAATVITWSLPVEGMHGIGGFSWLGPRQDFLKEFEPAAK